MNIRSICLRGLCIVAVAIVSVTAAQKASAPASPVGDFRPDWTFTGSSLNGWQTLGNVEWKAQSGEIDGSASSGSGGWIISPKPYQDIAFFARFQCNGSCNAGVLLRAQKTANGTKGLFVALTDTDLTAYKVTLDSNGVIQTKEILGRAGLFDRILTMNSGPGGRGNGGQSPNPAALNSGQSTPAGGARGQNSQPGAGQNGRGPGRGVAPGSNLPVPLPDLEPPKPGIYANEWNTIEVMLDADVMRPYLNGSLQIAMGETGDDGNDYGPVALWVGSGEVRFKDVSFMDLNKRSTPKNQTSPNYTEQRVDDFYLGWGVTAADFDRDGNMDIAAGPYIYYGPDFTRKQEIYLGRTYSAGTEFAPNMVTYAADFTGDGWPDLLVTDSRAMSLYVNPGCPQSQGANIPKPGCGGNRRWARYAVLPGINSEFALMADLHGDGKPDIVFGGGGAIKWAAPDPADPTAPWPVHQVSENGMAFAHSMGVGDINGDGRMDIVQTAGWWEQPPKGSEDQLWKYHPQAFGRWGRSEGAGGANIAVYDVNGDGLNDVVTGLNAHGFGLAWFEQKRDTAGNISFVRHMIIDDFSTANAGGVTMSEMHAAVMADMDGDGIPDYVTGKRHFAHLETNRDADVNGPAYLYIFHTRRSPKVPGGAEFVPEMVNNRSGVGSQFTVTDLNKDGAPDIVTATDRGVFIFWGKPGRTARTAARR
jgi:hypothetical protein